MRLKVLFHDNCFDGACSAAVFSRFYEERMRPGATLAYEGLSHKAGGAPIDSGVFGDGENVIVDFRYSQDPRLTWWFDHHVSAFQQPGDEAHFRADTSGRKFHDATRKSCTAYMADILAERFDWRAPDLDELIGWAELIDGAQFTSPKQAVELEEPALQLMTVLEANRDPAFIPRVIRALMHRPLAEVVAEPWVQEPLTPLLERHRGHIELVRSKARLEKGVVSFDLADEGLDSINKFIAYLLFPDARYTLWVGGSERRAKISLGSNPWRPELRKHDLSQLAEPHGGGGHPVVAAVSFPPDEVERAREIAATLRTELQSAGDVPA
ncbi:MAG TPA: hypothetical protein VK013_00430 [Myxococcaceae bacterium]|nr:hypothetical protein [Myxococcaceae bacterium]